VAYGVAKGDERRPRESLIRCIPALRELDVSALVRISPMNEGTTMSDDKTNQGPADRSRINVSEDYELRCRAEKFNVSPEKLKAAVGTVGIMADGVERFLGKK
jgi:hypothetical protein